MKKLMIWTAGGFGLALACGLAGLPHLSATLVTLTVFCAVPALLGVAWSLTDRIVARAATAAKVSVGGKREGRE